MSTVRGGSSARHSFVQDQACGSPWPGMCRTVSVLAAGLFCVIVEALGVGLGYDSLNVTELNKRDFPILGDSFQPDYQTVTRK